MVVSNFVLVGKARFQMGNMYLLRSPVETAALLIFPIGHEPSRVVWSGGACGKSQTKPQPSDRFKSTRGIQTPSKQKKQLRGQLRARLLDAFVSMVITFGSFQAMFSCLCFRGDMDLRFWTGHCFSQAPHSRTGCFAFLSEEIRDSQ